MIAEKKVKEANEEIAKSVKTEIDPEKSLQMLVQKMQLLMRMQKGS